ncbi:MAG: ATP-binding protein [Lachnospiraceae bacterium]|nr:ATP-binding protein [Lachnospiraceae bacterium]
MSLSKYQYDEIMRDYERMQTEHRRKKDLLMQSISSKFPRIEVINQEISSVSIAIAKATVLDNKDVICEYREKLQALRDEKADILNQAGYKNIPYYCPDCKDTGYLDTGKKCHCFRQKELELLYSQSNIKNAISRENFDTFSYEYYSPSYIDKATNISALTNIKKVVIDCRSFIENFDSRNPNLFLYGSTGVGKTFLTNCIAKELLDRYHSVIYLSAIQLFDLLAEESFSRDNNSSFTDDILNCDLLIIDDLGTELNNSFTISALFNCLNERLLRKHSTIISSNLSLEDLQNQYNERLFSRIIGNYKTLKIFGEDIRFLKRN